MKNSKTFKLFISSTFNDFREERKLLQAKVFPVIKEYCADRGYRFQPIDLRWGISDEAQLDQKALELCLDEVKTCKSYPNPNFLLMLGDRYGWVPLPYCIEQIEFEELLKTTNSKEKSSLLNWYELDQNQLPTSYILKHRNDEYKEVEKWSVIENSLLKTLQYCANQSALPHDEKRKYFTSATETEIEEGVIAFNQHTEHQKKLLKGNPSLEKEDAESIFGFLRNIEKRSSCSEKFISEDYEKAQLLKAKVSETLLTENTLNCSTFQTNKDDLNQGYLEEFRVRVIHFLKGKLNKQIARESTFTELELEKQEQYYFALQKRQNFLGQEFTLEKIYDYVSNGDEQPFVLYGKSGCGKSSIIAQAIGEVEKSKKVIYRFVGASSNSSSSLRVLISVLSELGFNAESQGVSRANLSDAKGSFDESSLRIKESILAIEEDVVIFIDAVDQLTNTDQFLWLPSKLPENVKIIISALNDEDYAPDSSYFRSLANITNNIQQVDQFNRPSELIKNLLEKENRTLQAHQLSYFLNQYSNCKTPLYVYIASQEIKHWKSFNSTIDQKSINHIQTKSLANSQKGVIQEFIENLSELFHHDKGFVEKVLVYIYASKDGVSENELLEVLNTDDHFIQNVTTNAWHKNSGKKLPLVIWTRLYFQLKPFLSKKNQDNEELLFFFHRDFIDVIRGITVNNEHENLIDASQKLITEYQDANFSSNRYGILFVNSLIVYIENNCNNESVLVHPILDHNWITFFKRVKFSFVQKLFRRICAENLDYSKHIFIAYKIVYFISRALYKNNNEGYIWLLISIHRNIYFLWNTNRLKEAVELGYEFDDLNTNLDHGINTKMGEIDYSLSIFNALSGLHGEYRDYDKSLEYNEKSLSLVESAYAADSGHWVKQYIETLMFSALIYNRLGIGIKGLKESEKAYELAKEFSEKNPAAGSLILPNISFQMGMYYMQNGQFDLAEKRVIESYLLIKPKFKKNSSNIDLELYGGTIAFLAEIYCEKEELKKAIIFGKEAIEIFERPFNLSPERWGWLFIKDITSLSTYYIENKESEKALELLIAYSTVIEPFLKSNPKSHINYLNELANVYKKNNRPKKAIELRKQSITIIEPLHSRNPPYWSYDYFQNLFELGIGYSNEDKIAPFEKVITILDTYLEYDNMEHVYITTTHNLIGLYEIYRDKHLVFNVLKKLCDFFEKMKNVDLFNDLMFVFIHRTNELSNILFNDGKLAEALKYRESLLAKLDILYNENPNKWREDILIQLKKNLILLLELESYTELENSKIKYLRINNQH